MSAVQGSPTAAAVRPQGRPRSEACRQAVLRAAYELLGEGGLSRFTIEQVAARSGVARTTIYRWWPSKGILATEAFLAAVAPQIAVPRTSSVLADIKAQVRLFARVLQGPAGQIVRSIIAAAQSDPETARAFRSGYVAVRRQEVNTLLQEAIARSELPAGLDLEAAADSLYAPLYHRLLLGIGPLDDNWVDHVCDFALRAAPQRPQPGDRCHPPDLRQQEDCRPAL
jgi:AcrR family transcriptional regulator